MSIVGVNACVRGVFVVTGGDMEVCVCEMIDCACSYHWDYDSLFNWGYDYSIDIIGYRIMIPHDKCLFNN